MIPNKKLTLMLIVALAAFAATPQVSATTTFVPTQEYSDGCTVNVVFASCADEGACTVNAVLASCDDNASCTVNVFATCTENGSCAVNVVATCSALNTVLDALQRTTYS